MPVNEVNRIVPLPVPYARVDYGSFLTTSCGLPSSGIELALLDGVEFLSA
jgi:hypothetical protein